MKQIARISQFVFAATLVLVVGCSMPKLPKLESFPGVYRIDVQQGNVITQKMVDQLKPGMTKRQVQYVMGTALVQDTFQQDRWDYIYSFQPGGEIRQQENISLYFSNGLLTHFDGDYVPTDAITN